MDLISLQSKQWVPRVVLKLIRPSGCLCGGLVYLSKIGRAQEDNLFVHILDVLVMTLDQGLLPKFLGDLQNVIEVDGAHAR